MLRILSLGWRPARAAGMLGSSELTWTGVFCILGTRPIWSREKSSGPPLDSMKSLVSVRWPSWTKEKGMVWLRFRHGAVGDVFPGGILDGVVVDDAVAGVDAGFGGWGFGLDVVGDGGAVEELLHLVVEHGDAGHEAEGEDEVGDGAGEGDEDALPAGMGVEFAGIGGGWVSSLPEELSPAILT